MTLSRARPVGDLIFKARQILVDLLCSLFGDFHLALDDSQSQTSVTDAHTFKLLLNKIDRIPIRFRFNKDLLTPINYLTRHRHKQRDK